jgi:hypothetical protein
MNGLDYYYENLGISNNLEEKQVESNTSKRLEDNFVSALIELALIEASYI